MLYQTAPESLAPSLVHRGKTRDTHSTTNESYLLVVATDRLSTHNVVHKSLVPAKGEVLTALTIFWALLLNRVDIDHHLVAYGEGIYPYLVGSRDSYPPDLHHRAIVVRKLRMIPAEFIYRNYLTGSLWKKFYSRGSDDPYGLNLPLGLPLMHRFDHTAFTPTDKSATDNPLNAKKTRGLYPTASQMGDDVFGIIRCHLNERGIELVDSKFEFGADPNGVIMVADEIVTPDSSRFCELSEIKEGVEPPWLDKEVARQAAEKIWGDRKPCPLEFESAVVQQLTTTYLGIFKRITGMTLEQFQGSY